MLNTSNRSVVKESILVIATKDNVDFTLGDFAEANVENADSKTGTFKQLLEKLKSIPSRDRATAIQVYEIKGK